MEMRQIRRYPLNITINNFNQLIPPAIFHTIIENGITHNRTKSEEINFYISEVSNNENVTYQIIAYYKKLDVPINLHEIAEIMDQQTLSEANIKVGTGINYVTARLTERYGENWELKCYETKDIWLTTIKIPIKVL
jgi:LytS/YehU family sensor histidine kinase